MKLALLHAAGVHVSVVILFLVNFAVEVNKNLGLYLLASVKVEMYADLTVLRVFL